MSIKKLALGILALTFLVPLVPAGAQVVVAVGHPHHRHCYWRHHHRHCYYR